MKTLNTTVKQLEEQLDAELAEAAYNLRASITAPESDRAQYDKLYKKAGKRAKALNAAILLIKEAYDEH